MLDRIIEFFRGRKADSAKARAYLATRSTSLFRESLEDYDLFTRYVGAVEPPAILIGTARDSSGREVPIEYALDDLYCMSLIQGMTGSGKTSFATHIHASALMQSGRMGVIDCKSGFYDTALEWAGAMAYAMDEDTRDAFIRPLCMRSKADA